MMRVLALLHYQYTQLTLNVIVWSLFLLCFFISVYFALFYLLELVLFFKVPLDHIPYTGVC
jgi:hypothetical protein